ncbi:MAG: hypothetical protein ACRDPD_13160, partial [Streptosporangiaceae bacterium]
MGPSASDPRSSSPSPVPAASSTTTAAAQMAQWARGSRCRRRARLDAGRRPVRTGAGPKSGSELKPGRSVCDPDVSPPTGAPEPAVSSAAPSP